MQITRALRKCFSVSIQNTYLKGYPSRLNAIRLTDYIFSYLSDGRPYIPPFTAQFMPDGFNQFLIHPYLRFPPQPFLTERSLSFPFWQQSPFFRNPLVRMTDGEKALKTTTRAAPQPDTHEKKKSEQAYNGQTFDCLNCKKVFTELYNVIFYNLPPKSTNYFYK